MSVVLLVVLLLSIQLQVAVSSSSNQEGVVVSRESSRLAMAIALGNLQKVAGEDRRSTARAEVLGAGVSTSGSSLWTGVWDAENPGNAPEWLVSGSNPDPVAGAGASSKEILPGNSSQEAVEVNLDEIASDGAVVARVGWWVGGEASTVSLSGGRRGTVLYESSSFESQRSSAEYVTPFGVDLSSIFPSAEIDEDDDQLASLLQESVSETDVLFIQDSAGAPLADLTTLQEVEVDLAVASYGVLENPVSGGLKVNLSDSDYRDSFLANDDLAEFLGPKGDYLEVDSGVPDRRDYAGKPFFSPRPILSEAVLYMGLFHTWSDAKVRVRYHFEAEFWNPYPLPLRFPRDTDSSYDRGVVLYFDGLPTITVSAENYTLPTGWSVPELEEDLDDFSSYSASDSRTFINSWIEISPSTDSNSQPVLEPGEVYQVMEPDPLTQARGLARDFDTERWSASAKTKPDDNADIRIKGEHPAGGVTLTMVPYDSSGDIKELDPIAEFEGLAFDDFEVVRKFRTGANPFSRDTSSSYTIEDYVFAYHFRVGTDETDMTSMRDLQTAVDLREPSFEGSESYEDVFGTDKVKNDLVEPIGTDPSYIVQDDANLFSFLDQIMDRTARSHSEDYRLSILYDLPDGDAISIGQLASVSIHRRAPRSIGNAWGEELNEAFDTYYLSPKFEDTASASGSDRVLGNPWIRQLSDDPEEADSEDAVFELVDGSFNINSTSLDVWRAVLRAPVRTPQGLDESRRGRDDVYRTSTYFRLPGYQADIEDFYMSDAELQNPDRVFAQGIRVLDDNQVDAIAAGIVEKIEARGEPFYSVSEFVSSGIISDAIEEAGSDPADAADPINDGFMERSNVYLEQSDIITRMAPFMTSRSDTFRVRAYGEVVDPITGETVSSTICEAVVQRLPEKVDGSDPMDPTTSVADSRRFRVLRFEWSDES